MFKNRGIPTISIVCSVLIFMTLGQVRLAAAQETTNLRVSIIPIVDVAPLIAAIEQGFFEEENLIVDTSPVAGGAAGVPGLVGGAYQIAFTNVVSTILAREQGIDIQIIAPGSATGASPPDDAGLIARSGEGIATGADLEGKSVAVNTRNNIIWLFAREWVAQTGGDPDKVNFREVPFPQMLDALRGEQVDAAFIVQPMLLGALNDPAFDLVGWPYNTVQPSLDIAQYVATSEYIENNPEVLVRFRRALSKGVDWFNENIESDEVIELVSGYTRIPADVLQNVKFSAAPDSVREESPAAVMELMHKHDLLEEPSDLEGLINDLAR